MLITVGKPYYFKTVSKVKNYMPKKYPEFVNKAWQFEFQHKSYQVKLDEDEASVRSQKWLCGMVRCRDAIRKNCLHKNLVYDERPLSNTTLVPSDSPCLCLSLWEKVKNTTAINNNGEFDFNLSFP